MPTYSYLEGPSASFTIARCSRRPGYLFSVWSHGGHILPNELQEVLPRFREGCTTQRALRDHLRYRISSSLSSHNDALILLGGDFNWTVEEQDRCYKTKCKWTGTKDDLDERDFQRQLGRKFNLFEAYQAEMTHENGMALSRLDRIYLNDHQLEHFDREYSTVALDANTLSDHRAVGFRKQIPDRKQQTNEGVSYFAARHADFPRRVQLEFDSSLRSQPSTSPLVRLALYKKAMAGASRSLQHAHAGYSQVSTLEDRISCGMRFVRAMERGSAAEVSKCLLTMPEISEHVSNPYAFDGNLTRTLRALRNHLVTLFREQALQQAALAVDLEAQGDRTGASKAKTNATRLLTKLTPGKSGSMGAVRASDGSLATSATDMAKVLRLHWGETFKKRGINPHLLQRWIREDIEERQREGTMQAAMPDVRISRSHVEEAVRSSNNSAAGPDGVPYAVWRRMGACGIDVLFEALDWMITDAGQDELIADFPFFNISFLHFLPKQSVGKTEEGLEIYSADSVRPLNVCNTDNRILASATRRAIEPILAKNISILQRGFIGGRDMLDNLFDVEEAMIIAASTGEGATALFFDFAAAFPSVEHEVMFEYFSALGWPSWLRNMVWNLYTNYSCLIVLGSKIHAGFDITRGIRQGCPLSPLLFAAMSELLLRRLQRLCPAATSRAWADDLAMVVPDTLHSLPMLFSIFHDFALISGLFINIAKTVMVPLYPYDLLQLRASIHQLTPAWGAIGISGLTKYLGFMLGPEKRLESYTKPLAKYKERASQWGRQGLGLHLSLRAYSIYIASVLGFVTQLEPLPTELFDAAEVFMCRRLFPGPNYWVKPAVLHLLRELGSSIGLQDVRATSVAARSRVFRAFAGGSGIASA